MNRFIKIGEAAKILGVSIQTLRRWEESGYLISHRQDLGSGMNYQKKGLKSLINRILEKQISRLVLTHKDRLLRFGSELIFTLCEIKQIEVIIINKGEDISFEEELELISI